MKLLLFLLVVLAGIVTIVPPTHAQYEIDVPLVELSPTPLVATQSARLDTRLYELPHPGLLPDHPLYILKVARDRIVLWTARDPIRKIEIKHHLADKRLAMGKELIASGKVALGSSVISKGEKYLYEAINDLEGMTTGQTMLSDMSLIDRIIDASSNHRAIIEELYGAIPDNQRESLGLSLQLSIENENAITTLKESLTPQ